MAEARRAIEWGAANLMGFDPMGSGLDSIPHPWSIGVYDLVGKALDVPVWWLMGDKVRDRVPVSYWSNGQ